MKIISLTESNTGMSKKKKKKKKKDVFEKWAKENVLTTKIPF
jgi:hypothetical protein